ncbi:hypothetical protein CYLTODRAFT_437433 [Cylindrobasidium torrendii FP15055 ss-10]|uniref:Mediator of RNA polymerase II transcription subunit 10 n=1 Tax=Cylindrobasidium torrendii FP15055 ss-10 TaxID=1314674 RepID=A0A0D7BAA5_9AGAR|nr:hypothetical protein CYLTODRAFT_437433 [Cylindrobasidium torrendii FP15055 ss-10]
MAMPPPDSPRASQSPPPEGIQGDLELELLALANALYNLGTTVVNDSTKERDHPGGQPMAKPVGAKVNEVIQSLSRLDDMGQHVPTKVPTQILMDIDNGRNPGAHTRTMLERTALENQFMNGKVTAVESYSRYLNEALSQNFPDIAEFLPPIQSIKEEPTANGVPQTPGT